MVLVINIFIIFVWKFVVKFFVDSVLLCCFVLWIVLINVFFKLLKLKL